MSHPFHSLRYHLLDILGAGGMGVVYRARDRLNNRIVALKRVTLDSGGQDSAGLHDIRLALTHEFRTLASLRHPHIISVLDYGFDAQRQPFFTMELLEQSQTIVSAGRTGSLIARISLLLQACEALAYLHRRGILHHDLKPENVLVADGRVRLLDFGLAVLSVQSRDDDAFGSLRYLAPEVLDGEAYTESADLYSLGVIAYELLAGGHPFSGETFDSFIEQLFTVEPDLERLAVPPAVAHVVAQLMSKDPACRPSSAQATIGALHTALDLPFDESPTIRESYLQAATFVGREAEMSLLACALHQARTGHGGAWLIGGESGVGKSRLLRELETLALVDGFVAIRGQAIQEQGASFQLWRDVLRQLLVVSVDVDDLTASVIGALVPDIGDLLGRPIMPAPPLDGQAGQIRLLTSIVSLFERQSEPIVLLLEDLQWANESLLPLPHVIRIAANRPLLVIGSYRDDERPDLADQLPEMRSLPLARLNPQQVAALSAAMLGEAGKRPELVARLQQETEGNTFFLVEVVRALAEDAGRLAAVGRNELPTRLMPRGIESAIERRLARLPAAAHPLLTLAAIVGRQLDLAVLQRLAPDVDLVNWWLPLCAEAAVLEVRDQYWQFSHDKIREGLLVRLAPEQIPGLHGIAAEVLEGMYGAEERYAGQLAYHWGQAGRADKEAGYCLRAGRYARQQGSVAEAANVLARAFAVTPPDNRQAFIDIHLERGQINQVLGDWGAAEADFRAALGLARRAEDAAGAQLALGKLFLLRSEYDIALEWLAHARAGYVAMDLTRGLARVNIAEGVVWMRQGVYDQAREYLRLGLSYARAAGDAESVALSLNNLGNVALRQSDYPAARSLYEESLAIRQTLGDVEGIASCLSNLALVALNQGNPERSWRLNEESLALRRAMGDKAGIAGSLNNLGTVAATQGDIHRARSLLTESLRLSREIGDDNGISGLLNTLGGLAMDEGDYVTARPLLEEGIGIRRVQNDSFGLVSSLTQLGALAQKQGDYREASAHFAEGIKLAGTIGDKEGVAYCLAGFALLALSQGDARRSVWLVAAASGIIAAIGGALDLALNRELDAATTDARAILGMAAFREAWDAGSALSVEAAMRFAIDDN